MRSLIRKLVIEALETQHFRDRVSQRIHDPRWIEPALDVSRPDHAMALLRRVTFPRNVSISVSIFKSKVVYSVEVDGKIERGNNLWVIVRGNEMETVFFRNGENPPSGTEYQISIDSVWSVVDEKGSYDMTQQDLERITRQHRTSEPRKRGKEVNLPLVVIRGSRWYADVDNNRFIYAKNIHKTMSFDDAFNTLPEEELDAILAQLPSIPTLA